MSWSPERGPVLGALPSYDRGPVATPDEPWYGRRGRLTPQRVADFTELYTRFGLSTPDAIASWRPEVLEIGFGAGESLLGLVRADRMSRVLGVEPFAPGVLALMRALEAAAIDNVRVTRTNVVTLLPMIAEAQLALVRILFPDPWPKRRHGGRRLVRQEFAARVEKLLAPGGVLHVATDSAPYAHEVRVLLSTFDELVPATPPARGRTRYESYAVRAGRAVHDLAWQKRPDPAQNVT